MFYDEYEGLRIYKVWFEVYLLFTISLEIKRSRCGVCARFVYMQIVKYTPVNGRYEECILFRPKVLLDAKFLFVYVLYTTK